MAQNEEQETIRINLIDPNPHRDLKIRPLFEETLVKLAESIKERGIIQPIKLRKHPNVEGRYQQAFGHHRLEAARLAGRTELRKEEFTICIASDKDMLEMMNDENDESYNKGTVLHVIECVAAVVKMLAEGTYTVVIPSQTPAARIRYAPSFIPGKALQDRSHPYTAKAISQLLGMARKGDNFEERASDLVRAALNLLQRIEMGEIGNVWGNKEQRQAFAEMNTTQFIKYNNEAMRRASLRAQRAHEQRIQSSAALDPLRDADFKRHKVEEEQREDRLEKLKASSKDPIRNYETLQEIRERDKDPIGYRLKEVQQKLSQLEEAEKKGPSRFRATRIEELKSEMKDLKEQREAKELQRQREPKTEEEYDEQKEELEKRLETKKLNELPAKKKAQKEKQIRARIDSFINEIDADVDTHSEKQEEIDRLFREVQDTTQRMRIRNALLKLSAWADDQALRFPGNPPQLTGGDVLREEARKEEARKQTEAIN